MDVIPGCEIKYFGSFHTRLYLPNADIDLVVVHTEMNEKTMYQKIAK